MPTQIFRRDFVRRLLATGAAFAMGPTAFESLREDEFVVTLGGRRTTLVPLHSGLTTVSAQWTYQQYQFYQYQQYQRWQQWNAMQYQAYMQQMALQYAWVQAYQAAMAQQMQGLYAQGYTMSEPFAMDSVRSLYSYGSTASGNELLTGYNRYRSAVRVSGRTARLVDAVQEIGDDLDFDEEDKERASGPQSSSRRNTKKVSDRSIAGQGFRTEAGEAWVSDEKFKDNETDDKGNLIIFDSVEGREMRLVPLYD